MNRDISVRVDQFPAPGETRSGTTLVQTLGGIGANQAVAADRAGSEVSFLAAVGADETGVQLRKELSGHGLTTDRVRTVPGSSGTACITVDDKGENCIVVVGGANQTWNSLDLADELLIRGGDVLVVTPENDLELVMKAAEMARSVRGDGTRVGVVPRVWPMSWAYSAVNRGTAARTMNREDSDDDQQ